MADLDDLSDLTTAHAYRIHRISRLLRRNLLVALSEVSRPAVTPEQFFLLFRLSGSDGLFQGDLVDPALNDRPNISRQVDALCRLGLVERRADSSDRRRKRLHLTAGGRALMDRLRPRILAERRALFGGLSQAELAGLERALDHLQSVLE